MSEDAILNPIEKEMIALGVSIAAGCQPCTRHHIKAARAAGTSGREMTLAVTASADIRRAATEAMAAWSIEQLGGATELPGEWLAQQERIRALVSVAAAFAVNSVVQFQLSAEQARHAGATDRQIQLAVAIARKIRGVAAEKVEAAAQELLAPQAQTAASPCGCSA